MMATRMNRNSGTSFAIVVTTLINAAPWTPFSTRVWTSHRQIEAPITEMTLLPLPNAGTNYDSALKMATA